MFGRRKGVGNVGISYPNFVDADQLSREDPLAETSLVLHPIVPHAQLLESVTVTTRCDIPAISHVEQYRNGECIFANKDLQIKCTPFFLKAVTPSLSIIGLECSQRDTEKSPIGEDAVDCPGEPGARFVDPYEITRPPIK